LRQPARFLKAILLFVKLPEPGRVKTRLAATLGPEQACAIYRRLVAAVCARLPLAAQLIVVFDPPDRENEVRAWVEKLCPRRRIRFIPQADGDLGTRLTSAFAEAFAAGFGPIAAIGSDCVELDAASFDEVWRALRECAVVLGPTPDGGYYLIGLGAPQPLLFEEIAWSTPAVFHQSVERAAAAGLRLHELPLLHDVDTEEDWRRAELRLTV
jgi:rSAM/selenodomain-associated transferase 1